MLLLLLALLTGAFRVSAQDSELSPHALSTKLLFLDYAIPNGASLDTLGISNGVELAYIRNINNYLNLAFPAKIELANVSGYINKRTIVSADAVLQLQYYREDFWVVPYIFGGGGIASEEFDVNRVEFPMGVGANIRLGPNSYLNLQGEYRKSQSEDRDNLQYGIGYWFRLGPRDPNTIDQDNDGISDAADQCPTEAGPAATFGCPDTDLDGVADKVDECPDEAGPATTLGCPDTDGDGIDDSKDNCPNSAGPMSNNGCPEIKKEEKEFLEFAAQSVQFATGKATLKAESFAILDQVAEILLRYPDYKVRINGHTDAIGAANANQVLSEERARSCYEYLVSRSVPADRLQYKGYGESKPIATNDTEEGREENRRVEFELYIK